MKKIIFYLVLIGFHFQGITQVSINNNGNLPDSSALLDIQSNTKGLLIPRMSNIEMNAIENPANGLLVYNKTNKRFFYNKGPSSSPSWHHITGENDVYIAFVYTNNMVYGLFSNDTNLCWFPQAVDGPIIGSSNCDIATVVFTATTAYGFCTSYGFSGTWYSQPLDGTPISIMCCTSAIVVVTTTTVYGFCSNYNNGNGFWYSQTLNGPPVDIVPGGGGPVVYTPSTAYGFCWNYSGFGSWHSQPLSEPPVGSSYSYNTTSLYSASKVYVFTSNPQINGSGTWYTQTLTGTIMGVVP